jgi:hypothetical protein
MKTPTRKPRQRINEKLGDYNARLREWIKENNASTYAIHHARRGGELSEDEQDRNIEAIRARIADEPDLPVNLAPSYKPHKHAEDERMEDYEAGDTPQAAPLELGHLQHQLAALTVRVVELEKLVAASVAYRSLKPSAKAKVDKIDPSVGAAFKDKRTLLALTVFEHVAELPRKKKVAANFPKLLLGEYVDSSVDETVNTVRVIPYTALLHRLAAKKDFRPSLDETSSQDNARRAIEKSGLIVTTMHEAGIRQGSALLVVMDRTEAEACGLVRKSRDVEIQPEDEPEIQPAPTPKQSNPRFTEWNEPEPTTEDVVDEPTTTDVVGDEEIDTEPWEEEEDDGFNDDPIALFHESGEQQKAAKSSKAIDLFA